MPDAISTHVTPHQLLLLSQTFRGGRKRSSRIGPWAYWRSHQLAHATDPSRLISRGLPAFSLRRKAAAAAVTFLGPIHNPHAPVGEFAPGDVGAGFSLPF